MISGKSSKKGGKNKLIYNIWYIKLYISRMRLMYFIQVVYFLVYKGNIYEIRN